MTFIMTKTSDNIENTITRCYLTCSTIHMLVHRSEQPGLLNTMQCDITYQKYFTILKLILEYGWVTTGARVGGSLLVLEWVGHNWC